MSGDTDPPDISHYTRKALAFLEARFHEGVQGEFAMDDILAEVGMEGATESLDLSLNMAKFAGAMSRVAIHLLALRQHEHGDSPEETLNLLTELEGKLEALRPEEE